MRAGSISRLKTGWDKGKDNKRETKDRVGMHRPVPMDSSQEAVEMQGENTLEGDQAGYQALMLSPTSLSYCYYQRLNTGLDGQPAHFLQSQFAPDSWQCNNHS